ncbi:MAG: DUF4388 domain-containing protein [Calditrichaceae bacterium]|nr:DUF4388 domain-containing protein [Calditrichaceae bacterium]
MALVGNLKDLKLPSLIQLNCMERNTAKLTIEADGQYGFLYFDKGQVVHAEYDPDIGEKAVFRMLNLYSGQFKVESGIRAPVKSINTSWNNLLLDGLNQMDGAEDNPEQKFTHLFEKLFTVKGLKSAHLLTPDGKVIASSSQNAESHNYLHALVSFQSSKIGDILARFHPEFMSLATTGERLIFTKYNKLDLIMVLDNKSKLDVVLPFLKQAIGQ